MIKCSAFSINKVLSESLELLASMIAQKVVIEKREEQKTLLEKEKKIRRRFCKTTEL